MKGKLLKVLSLAMAIALVASLAACGGNNDEETTAPADTTVAGDVTPGDDVTGEEASSEEATVTEVVTDKEGHTQIVVETKAPNAPTKAPGQNPNTPATNIAVPKNAAEAMKLFNDALGKTSISGKMTSVGLNKADATIVGDLRNLDPKVEPTFKSETIRKFNNKLYPISNATLNGTPKAANGKITMSFKLAHVDDVNAAYGVNGYAYFVTQNEAKATVSAVIKAIGEVAENLKIKIKSINGITLDGTMDVVIDQNTGKLVSATYKFTEGLKGKASAMGIPGITVDIIGVGTCTYTGK